MSIDGYLDIGHHAGCSLYYFAEDRLVVKPTYKTQRAYDRNLPSHSKVFKKAPLGIALQGRIDPASKLISVGAWPATAHTLDRIERLADRLSQKYPGYTLCIFENNYQQPTKTPL